MVNKVDRIEAYQFRRGEYKFNIWREGRVESFFTSSIKLGYGFVSTAMIAGLTPAQMRSIGTRLLRAADAITYEQWDMSNEALEWDRCLNCSRTVCVNRKGSKARSLLPITREHEDV